MQTETYSFIIKATPPNNINIDMMLFPGMEHAGMITLHSH